MRKIFEFPNLDGTPNPAAAVNAPVAPSFHTGRLGRRVTVQRRWAMFLSDADCLENQ
jgi:hypothetical protein